MGRTGVKWCAPAYGMTDTARRADHPRIREGVSEADGGRAAGGGQPVELGLLQRATAHGAAGLVIVCAQ
ncbi:hypothetical protein [Streptomyces zagrosensis]|uniref:Uncharacterized protein n=1 Tax=Streptomyces zagrosensis TaxID=1042984 RepID=A0A7W9Q9M8_9ACTN|nr:hypothetical protein [Streptomyces zagrosensis]